MQIRIRNLVNPGSGMKKSDPVLEFLNNQVGKYLSPRPARLRRPADLIPWNEFLGSLRV
jgi:hypothetical protein